MKLKIDIENYEAFYLDYLEGNLDENLTLELFSFLANHPELQIEDLGPMLSSEEISLEQTFKQNLKHDSFTSKINSNNIEFFLTAEKENQLSENKIHDLHDFLTKYPEFDRDRKLFQLASIEPDKNIVFPNKSKLKQRKTIVLWPYISGLVAASAALLIWFWPTESSKNNLLSAANKISAKPWNKNNHVRENLPTRTEKTTSTVRIQTVAAVSLEKNNTISNSTKFQITEKIETKNVAKLETLQNFNLSKLEEKEPKAVAFENANVVAESNNNLAMNEAYKPITRKISDVIKTQVEYQTGSNSAKNRKGFFLKIGSIEIYQNKKVKH